MFRSIAVLVAVWGALGVVAVNVSTADPPAASPSPSKPVFEPQPIPGADFPGVPSATAPAPVPENRPQNNNNLRPEPRQNPGFNFPGLEQFLTPDGFALPGGAGFIHRGENEIGIQINTPDG